MDAIRVIFIVLCYLLLSMINKIKGRGVAESPTHGGVNFMISKFQKQGGVNSIISKFQKQGRNVFVRID